MDDLTLLLALGFTLASGWCLAVAVRPVFAGGSDQVSHQLATILPFKKSLG